MKVKTFTGNDPAKVDADVNKWIATSGVKVALASTALTEVTIMGTSNGKPISRKSAMLAISVWYSES